MHVLRRVFILASCLLAGSLYAQPEQESVQASAASLEWLLERITPNDAVPDPDPGRRRLLVSYVLAPKKFPHRFHRSSIYDNALAVLAFLISGKAKTAAGTLNALSRLVRADGSLWFSYSTADNWPDESDHDGALIRAGAIGWVGYAFTFFLSHAPPCRAQDEGCTRERALFLETARRLATYLLSLRINAEEIGQGLLRLGHGTIRVKYRRETNEVIEVYRDEPALGISSENNISAWFFLRELARLTGESQWRRAADRIGKGLLRSAWKEDLGQFVEGFSASLPPEKVKALDCASWGALFLLAAGETGKARRALESTDYFRTRDGEAAGYRPYVDTLIFPDIEVGRFYFPDNPRERWRDLPLVWSEGTLGVALARLRSGDAAQAREILAGLRPLKTRDGGMRYASREVPHHMSEAPSVAASAWHVVVAEALAGNPLAEQFWK